MLSVLDLALPAASLVMVNYNGGDEILRCLESVLPTLDDSTEIILVDNNLRMAALKESPAAFQKLSSSGLVIIRALGPATTWAPDTRTASSWFS
jgi:hypothetical protein